MVVGQRGLQLGNRLSAHRLDEGGDALGLLGGGALRHLDTRDHVLALDVGEEAKLDQAAGHQAYREQNHRDGRDDDEAVMLHAKAQGTVERSLDEPTQQPRKSVLDTFDACQNRVWFFVGVDLDVRQMCRQNEQRFDQRKHQHGNHDDGDVAHELADLAGHKQQRRKRDDGRKNGETHRH